MRTSGRRSTSRRPSVSGGLVADDQDRAPRILDVVLEVVQHAARLAHAARRDDDARLRPVVQGDALVDLVDVVDPLLAEQVGVLLQQPQRLVVEAFRVRPEHLGGPHRHRAVHEDRQVRQPAGVHELVQEVDDRLRAADAERRDDQLAAALRRPPHHLAQPLRRLLDRLVRVAAVGAFADEQVARRDRRRVAQDRQARPAQVARERQPPLAGRRRPCAG